MNQKKKKNGILKNFINKMFKVEKAVKVIKKEVEEKKEEE
jgi:hypothetical protein